MWGFSFFELFQRGGPVMWPLLCCSIVALAVAVERVIVMSMHHVSYETFVRMISNFNPLDHRKLGNQLSEIRSPLARVAEAYFENAEISNEVRKKAVEQVASFELTVLERRLHWLSIIGTVAPMLGLLGTVMGLVTAFHQIEVLGGQVQPGDLASGIWSALLTTVFGLIIALPTMAVYHFLNQRVGAIELQMDWLTTTLDKLSETVQFDEHSTKVSGKSKSTQSKLEVAMAAES